MVKNGFEDPVKVKGSGTVDLEASPGQIKAQLQKSTQISLSQRLTIKSTQYSLVLTTKTGLF
jgi:hypothetical protein